MEGGWGEAFENEYAQLNESMPMLDEDILGHQVIVEENMKNLFNFDMEQDELEVDQDEVMMREIQHLENIRCMEIQRCEERRQLDHAAKVRKQRNKWKIKSFRKNRMQRRSAQDQGLAEEGKMPYNEVQTIMTTKRGRFKRRHAQRRQARTTSMREEAQRKIRENGEGNLKIRKAYDEIVAGVKNLLGDFTLDARQNKTDYRADESNFCQKCGKIFCTCGTADGDDMDPGLFTGSGGAEAKWVDSDDDGW